MYDPTTKQLVWTGQATKTVDPSSNQEKNQKNLNKAMQKLLKDYPPKQSSANRHKRGSETSLENGHAVSHFIRGPAVCSFAFDSFTLVATVSAAVYRPNQ